MQKNKKEEKSRSVSAKAGKKNGTIGKGERLKEGERKKREGRQKGGAIESPRICEIPFSNPPPFFLEIPLNDIDHLCPIVDNL